ncbi:hypothetical protein FIBSPDRAFT_198479 [Athelia psychrophila]|uniref:Uncharacterized protein n=1 Tax=Athelia psychrophila TaxID=1759441 RepID=A0A165ZRK4_9AGAM|nr:hypothetical protein FIBSPDRAFT_198479 [Fibularhizoctonia sp. CBS 109695]
MRNDDDLSQLPRDLEARPAISRSYRIGCQTRRCDPCLPCLSIPTCGSQMRYRLNGEA